MEKFKELLKRKVEDETAAFAILGAMIITFTVTIGVWEYIFYKKTVEANASLLNINLEILPFIKILFIEIIYNLLITIVIYPLIQRLGHALEEIFKTKNILTRYF